MQVFNQGKKPFAFSWNGTSFIIPPVTGGTYKTVRKKVRAGGRNGETAVIETTERVSEKPVDRNYMDLPDDAARLVLNQMGHLHNGEIKGRAAVEAEYDAMLKARQEELAALDAKLEEKKAETAGPAGVSFEKK